ncbi:uncharacterized protein Fot_42319 [Forsythia ovata]|uniref:Uncharacterized protein n=1 Tax=Forsythia ovata TaxID=205694 RepID=A0ABD1RKW3_9LAMI
MASEFTEKKKLLYSDLFKGHQSMASSPSTESAFGSNGSSSSSALSSPVGSELGSTESSGCNDEDFIAELTRQITECMLQEDDCVSEESKLKNQPPVREEGRVSWGRRVRGIESTRVKQFYQTGQQYMQYKGGNWGNGHSGSGMRAVFLGGSGSSNGSSGTGVFLPRGSNVPAEQKKKSGCSTVLIPTRVLEALELHFNRSRTNHHTLHNQNDGQMIEEVPSSNKNENEEIQLPQEWTY